MLSVKHLKKNFGKNTVLKDISFDVSVGDIIAIVGPSGSGKNTNLPLTRQKIGMVFQQFNLFNHLSVLDNLMLAPVKL